MQDSGAIDSLLKLLFTIPPEWKASDSGVSRHSICADLVSKKLRDELLQDSFRDDVDRHICTLSLFVLSATTFVGAGASADDPRVVAVARIVGSFLAYDRPNAKQRLRRYLDAHPGLSKAQGQPWIDQFWRHVSTHYRSEWWRNNFVVRMYKGVKSRISVALSSHRRG